MLALSLAGEVFRRFGADWGWLVQVSLVFAGLMGLGVVLTSGAARSVLRRIVVQHSPLRFAGSPLRELQPSRTLGADTDALLAERLGLSADAIAALHDAKVV